MANTAGSWFAYTTRKDHRWVVTKDHGKSLARFPHAFGELGWDEDEVNARLMAAAPDLLEAAENIRNAIEGTQAHFDNQPEFAALQTAITKATDTSPVPWHHHMCPPGHSPKDGTGLCRWVNKEQNWLG